VGDAEVFEKVAADAEAGDGGSFLFGRAFLEDCSRDREGVDVASRIGCEFREGFGGTVVDGEGDMVFDWGER